jgi:transposase
MERQGVTPQSKAITPHQQRILGFDARIERIERERALLIKASALLMLEGIERTK